MEYQPAAGHEAITTSSLDNRFLPADYLETLNSYTGPRHKRFVRGLWVGSDGLVYDQWDRSRHVRERRRLNPR